MAAEIRLEEREADIKELQAKLQRTQSDLEHARTANNSLEVQLGEAHGRTEELRTRAEKLARELKTSENDVRDAVSEREALSQRHTELEETSKAEARALDAELKSLNLDNDTLTGERDQLAQRLANAEESMGWFARRKYNKK